jgi:hypothetical protein
MNDQPDVMRLLADARPPCFDQPADPDRRQADLRQAMAQSSTPTRDPVRTQLTPRRRLIGLTAAAGVTAVALVAAAAVTESPSPDGTSTASTPVAEPGQPRALLLAAEHVSTAPETGRYWRVTTESRALERASTAKGSFRLTYSGVDEAWAARSSKLPSWYVTHPWSRVPASSADRADWRQAGSPATFDLHGLNMSGKPSVITDVGSTGGKKVVDPMNPDSEVFSIGGIGKSMSDIRRLPAEEKALTAALLENHQRSVDAAVEHGRARPGEDGWSRQAWLFGTASEVLTLPVTPQVRATAYRIMAGLDGVQSLGQQSDVKGRTGNAVALRWNSSDGFQEDRLIIDAVTGLPLAQETRLLRPTSAMSWVKPTDIYSASVITRIGWTDDTPPARTKYVPSGEGVG